MHTYTDVDPDTTEFTPDEWDDLLCAEVNNSTTFDSPERMLHYRWAVRGAFFNEGVRLPHAALWARTNGIVTRLDFEDTMRLLDGRIGR